MNIFAGTCTLQEAYEIPDLDLDIIKISEKSYFVMWGDEGIDSLSSLVSYLEWEIWWFSEYDFTIDSESRLEILSSESEWEVYEKVVFSWPETTFDDILERFSDSAEVISIREGRVSSYGNREIIADFLY